MKKAEYFRIVISLPRYRSIRDDVLQTLAADTFPSSFPFDQDFQVFYCPL